MKSEIVPAPQEAELLGIDRFVGSASRFHRLTPRTRERLAGISRVCSWSAGEVLLRPGEAVPSVVELLEGKLRIVHTRPDGHEDLRKGVRHGGLIGLVYAVSHQPFPFQVSATGACEARHYDVRQMLALMEADGVLSLDLARCLATRAVHLELTGLEEREEPMFQRVFAALCRLRELGAGRPVPDGFSLTVSQYDLARMVGTSRQYVNVHLHQMHEMGLVRLGYRQILLLQSSGPHQSQGA